MPRDVGDDRPFLDARLDPDDWDGYRRTLHELVDACVDHLADARERPWRPPAPGALSATALDGAEEGVGVARVAREMTEHVLPYGSGNTHPRFFGWVQGTGNAAALAAEIVAATMNANVGGREHAAVHMERDVIRWARDAFGFPEEASGVLVTGTSQATVTALAVARRRALGARERAGGLPDGADLCAYAAASVHTAIRNAAHVAGLGRDAVRLIPTGADGGIDLVALAEAIDEDMAAGRTPFCLIGTAGSVDVGAFDDLDALADLARDRNLWLHVDGAFGAWLRLAREPWRSLVRGIERADSLACDFHKWMFVQYDVGLALIRDGELHRATFAARPAYLEAQTRGLGGGAPWFADYGVDLSRGFRALKVWATLRAYGSRLLGDVVTRNCQLAAYMGSLVEASDELALVAPVRSNVCCFRVADGVVANGAAPDALHERLAAELQVAGEAVVSTTTVDGRTVLRAAITNHRTEPEDVEATVAAVRRRAASYGAALEV
jgi:glutamate/tyrosine decarboxylase-like PLP-dependent enzyme